ncbi:uncharacterized protein [Triticum aestivum]|uniref:uncharacterized protein isoform X2 n=1 Tax=Triticum aestivum TaxID=4565 RepID=UPI001D00224C|nr:uncharacterized protein LOC123150509 isoform X2 [Triticum aestivum]
MQPICNDPLLVISLTLAFIPNVAQWSQRSTKSRGSRNVNPKDITPALRNATNLQRHPLGDISNLDMHSQRITVVSTSSKSEGPRNENSKNITPAPGNATNLQRHPLGDVSNVDMHSQMGSCLLNKPNGPHMETMLRGQTNTHPPPPGHVLDVDRPTQTSGVVDEPSISDDDDSLPTPIAITAANGADLAESSTDGDTTAKSIAISDSRQAKRAHDRERKRAYDRERREKLTSEQREQINARRRDAYRRKKELGPKFLEEQNRKTREQRKQRRDSLTAEERADMSAERKTRYMSRKNTPCPESIAMRRLDLPTTSAANQSLHSSASPVSTNMAGHTFKSDDSLSAKMCQQLVAPHTFATSKPMVPI